MKQKKFTPLLALTISLELILAPLPAMADDKLNEIINQATSIGTSIYNTATGQAGSQGGSPQTQGDMAALTNQQTPQADKYFNSQKLSMIPGLNEYLALNGINPLALNCATLPTTLFEAKNEVCRVGIMTDTGIPAAAQADEMFTYYNQYTQVNKLYKNYSASSNAAGQGFGLGCMDNAMQILNGFFKYRINELDKLKTNLESLNNQFREASLTDLSAIEESTAVLEGEGSTLAAKVKTKKPDLFDYGKRFDNAACKSMFPLNDINNDGKAGGLNGIQQKLKETYSQPMGNPPYSGESYSTAHNMVVADINALADKVSKQVELNFQTIAGTGPNGNYSSFLRQLPSSVSSSNNLNQKLNADFFSDLQTKFREKNAALDAQVSVVRSELGNVGIDSSLATSLLTNPNSGTFSSEVTTIQNRINNACVERTLSGNSSLDTIISKMYDPTASSFANKNAANLMASKLKDIFSSSNNSSLEKKLSDLDLLEKQTGSRLFLKMSSPYVVQEVGADGKLISTVVPTSNNRTPGKFFADVIHSCQAQFKVNPLGNKMSGEAVISKLNSLNQDYKSLAKQHALDAKNEVKKKLIECSSSTTANMTNVGSCKPDAFNTTGANFCANGAFACSQNMKQCSAQADKYVSDIKRDRTVRVNNYKALVEKNKKDIVRIFDTALSQFMREGESLRSLFGVGFSSPDKIQREVPEASRYLTAFQQGDEKLLLEDPDKYVEMFRTNIDGLKAKVIEQQDQILGGGVGKQTGILADHKKLTEQNYKAVIAQSEEIANSCIAKHDEFLKSQSQQLAQQQADQQKKMSEIGEKHQEFCDRYGLADTDPNGACDGNISELVDGALKAANTPDARKTVYDFSQFCRQVGSNDLDGESWAIVCGSVKTDASSEATTIRALCEERKKVCESSTGTINEDGKTVSISSACDDIKEEIVAAYQVAKKGSLPDEAPAFCNAGNDTQSNSKSLLDSFGGTNMSNPLAGSQ